MRIDEIEEEVLYQVFTMDMIEPYLKSFGDSGKRYSVGDYDICFDNRTTQGSIRKTMLGKKVFARKSKENEKFCDICLNTNFNYGEYTYFPPEFLEVCKISFDYDEALSFIGGLL